jgi:sirohydrochlorin cobaltochelatase
MNTPIIMCAFGASGKAVATYQELNQKLQPLLPGSTLLWAYSSPILKRRARADGSAEDLTIHSPKELLSQVAAEGYQGAILQSLHLFCGTEFHRLAKLADNAPLPCALGMPLFTLPQDFATLVEILRPTVEARPENTILVLGHGTKHPSWMAYPTLETILRRDFGRRIHVGVVEGYPDSQGLVEELVRSGRKKITIIPLFLVTGMHYRRDIIGEEGSWKTQLIEQGLDVEILGRGLGMLPGIAELIATHITTARSQLA